MKKLVGETESAVIVLEFKAERYFSVCGNEYGGKFAIFTEDQGEARAQKYLEDGELWRMAVEAESTTQSLDEWIEDVLNIDGWQHVLGDVEEIQVRDQETQKSEWRYTEYMSGGQINMHLSPEDFTKKFVDPEDLNMIFRYWKEYHLKNLDEVPQATIDDMKRIFTPETDLSDWVVYLDEI